MREAETMDFLGVISKDLDKIDRLITMLNVGRKISMIDASELRDFRLADQAASEARDMLDELIKIEKQKKEAENKVSAI
jgi:hypothetical protein